MGEPGQIILAKERLAREYGITDEAIRNYALYGDDDSIPADGRYTNISQFIHQLEREQQALSDEMGDAGYDYNRMSKYQRRLIDHAEALVKADERRRAARENPALETQGDGSFVLTTSRKGDNIPPNSIIVEQIQQG